MDETTKLIVEKFAEPILAAAFGFAGAAFRFYLRIGKLERRTKALNDRLDNYTRDNVKHVENAIRAEREVQRKRIEHRLEDLTKAIKLEIADHRNDLEMMIVEIRTNIRTVEDSSHDFAKEAALAQFMAQQNARWERIERNLGQIEGFLQMDERRR